MLYYMLKMCQLAYMPKLAVNYMPYLAEFY